jgi:hypothetical protein
MADITKEPWNDPAKNTIAANKRMEGTNVKAVLLVGPDGEPYSSTGGSLTVSANKGANVANTVVASSATDVLLLAAEPSRVEAVIENNSTEDLYVKYGTGATTSSFTKKLLPGDAIVVTSYVGVVHGVWSAVNGDAQITEVTP